MQKEGYKEHLNQSAVHSSVLRELTAEESSALKQQILQMYRDVAKVCSKHGITLLLGGGSALGCIRHKGFIPWDDDLDLLITRPDYEKFKQIFQNELGDKYLLSAPNYSKNAKARFPKIIKPDTVYKEVTDYNEKYPAGIFLDLFILEQVPENKMVRKIKGTWCSALMFFSTCAYWYEQRNPVMLQVAKEGSEAEKDLRKRLRIGRVCSLFMPASRWFDKVDKAVQYRGRTKLLGIPTGRKHYFGEIFEYSRYLPPSKGVFENLDVSIPGDYEAYLSNLYGDYMKIPPEEKRERHFVIEFSI